MDPTRPRRTTTTTSAAQSEVSSSGTLYAVRDPRKATVKRCCRRVLTFMCTQVGVGGLIVGYAVLGAFGFPLLENGYRNPKNEAVLDYTNIALERLWRVTDGLNVLQYERWSAETARVLAEFQRNVTKCIEEGYAGGAGSELEWTFPVALMFCLSVFTMIGYSNMAPRTVAGKVATIVYAVFGIPLYTLYFKNMGRVLAHAFRWTYKRVYSCGVEDNGRRKSSSSYDRGRGDRRPKRVTVPSTACLWVLFAYVAIGTATFSSWQSWSVMDSAYFCVTSLCKIGIGDFAPDHILVAPSGGSTTRLVITFVYLLFGIGIIAMCYDLMKEDVTEKLRNLKNDIRLFFEDLQSRALNFYKRRSSLERRVRRI